MNNDKHLISGEEYSLKDLFGGNWKIVIPDLQRDYCWGLETFDKNKKEQGELVSQFISCLLDGFKTNPKDTMSLGLIYGYEAPKGQIQLCDGQQRVTTLYLLVGVLNRKLGGNRQLENLLMSEFEQKDDQETQLQYAIRESTLYFLSDLVYHYFIKNNCALDEKNMPEWYYTEYEQDASIQAMLGAVRGMESLMEKEESGEINWQNFAMFVINKLRLVYYDMGDRSHGEETFVVINTTGEPLSASENLKPILVGRILNDEERKKRSDEWEEREEWFWKHRNKNRHETTSDALSNEFYVWYWQLQLLQERMWKRNRAFDMNPKEMFLKHIGKEDEGAEEYDSTNRWNGDLENVHKRFKALTLLCEEIRENSALNKVLTFWRNVGTTSSESISLDWLRNKSNVDVLLPLISFCEKYGDTPSFSQDIVAFARRLCKNSLDRQYERVRRNEDETWLDWRYVVQIIENTDDINELLTFDTFRPGTFAKRINRVKIACWYDSDEQMKRRYEKEGLDVSSMEMNEALRFDLSVLWDKEDYAVEDVQKRYANLDLLHRCLSENSDAPCDMANFYRLYRFLQHWGDGVGHVPYCTWEAEGFKFNEHKYEASYKREYQDAAFLTLLSENDVLEVLKRHIAAQYTEKDIDLPEDVKPLQYFKMWMLLKVLIANEKKGKLSYYWKAIGCYTDAGRNRINSDCAFSLSNSCPGYVNRFGVAEVNDMNYRNSLLLDTPLFASGQEVEYSLFKSKQIPEEELKIMDEYAHGIYKEFLTQYALWR